MFRNVALGLILVAGVVPGTASAQSGFEWEATKLDPKDKKKILELYARVSPEVYNRLLKDGLEATEGTTDTNPMILGGRPGAKRLRLGGRTYGFVEEAGLGEDKGKRVHVLKFIPARADDFTGAWETAASSGGAPMILKQSGDMVTGTYTFRMKPCTLSGTVKEGVLKGRYFQPHFPDERYREGTFTFTLSEDGTSFTGRAWDKNGKGEEKWNGNKKVLKARP